MGFKFSNYDCIGFDLNHTLVSYNIENLVRLEYSVLSKFMIKRWDADADYLGAPLRWADMDFLQKGLVVDVEWGNILKLSEDGTILEASHGTKPLCQKDIRSRYYGGGINSCKSDSLAHYPLDYSHGLPPDKWSLPDYSDMSALLVYARAVDSLHVGKSFMGDELWQEVQHGRAAVFKGDNFATDKGEYFPELKKNPEAYINKCSPEMLAWLRRVKETKITFLVTDSRADYTDFVARRALGDDWRSLFDIVVCNAEKPQFFEKAKPFLQLSGDKEGFKVEPEELTRGEIYSRGSWRKLYIFLRKITLKQRPKCLYVGDNLIQDVYGAGSQSTCDALVVSEELRSESHPQYGVPRTDEKMFYSDFWGSYFCHTDDKAPVETLWCKMMKFHSKICVPSIEMIARHNLDHAYKCFDRDGESNEGFYPAKPRGLPADTD